ncbi:MAG: helix-turn-helix domain-containing protein [Burkholderiales bacterium]
MIRTRHAPYEVLPRHQHAHGFAAVVLSGRYSEAGDTGRHRLEPGDVLVHRAYESHIDRFEATGADVLVIPLAQPWAGPMLGRVRDADEVMYVAENDPLEAAGALNDAIVPRASEVHDWPDLLARALHANPALALAPWASERGLHPGSLSRGFRQIFGVTPAHFRLVARTHRAIRALRETRATLGDIAYACGFADQAHLTRAVRTMCAMPPARVRATS